jgi:hypothetical protein
MKNLSKIGVLVCLALGSRGAFAQAPMHILPNVPDSSANTVTVQNDRWTAVTIYLVNGSIDRRLGVVEGFSDATLPLPSWAVRSRATVRLVARSANPTLDVATGDIELQAPARIGIVIPAMEVAMTHADTMSVMLSPDDAGHATITVDNPGSMPVNVFGANGAFEVRMGQVAARSRATLRFPSALVTTSNSVTVVVRPRSGLELASDKLHVRVGDHLALRVPTF